MEKTLMVIMCNHVAQNPKIPKVAIRTKPFNHLDSGWQIRCKAPHHDDEGAQMWSLAETTSQIPAFSDIADSEIDTAFEWLPDSPTAWKTL